MTVFRILIFCLRLAGDRVSSLLCCLVFWRVISLCMFHLREGISWMPRYVYGSFCVRVGKFFVLYVMFCDWIYALNVFGLSFDLLGHPVIAYFARLRSISDHSANFCSLVIWGWTCCILLVIMAKSSAYAVVEHVDVDVLKWYPRLSFSSHRSRGSKKMRNRYGLRVSPCMVPRLIFIWGVVPKMLPVKDVVEFSYMLPTISTASMG